MSVCLECGLEENAWPHRVNHPAVRTRPQAHLFVKDTPKLGVPTKRVPKHRDFVVGDLAIWSYRHANRTLLPVRVLITGFNKTGRNEKLYAFRNHEDEWDVNTYLSRWEDLTLVTWELGGSR